MDFKISPLTDSNLKVLQSQTGPRINDQGAVSGGVKDYDVKEAPIIRLIRMMKLGKNVNFKV